MKVLAAVLIISAIWLVLASVRDGRGAAGGTVVNDEVWMMEQHDPVVRLGTQAAFPAGHPLARMATDPADWRD